MDEMKLGLVESKFADIIWNHEPLTSRTLVELCQKELGWKKSTTYTVLKKLCERGIFQNLDGTVSSVICRADFYAMQSENLYRRPLPVPFLPFWLHLQRAKI